MQEVEMAGQPILETYQNYSSSSSFTWLSLLILSLPPSLLITLQQLEYSWSTPNPSFTYFSTLTLFSNSSILLIILSSSSLSLMIQEKRSRTVSHRAIIVLMHFFIYYILSQWFFYSLNLFQMQLQSFQMQGRPFVLQEWSVGRERSFCFRVEARPWSRPLLSVVFRAPSSLYFIFKHLALSISKEISYDIEDFILSIFSILDFRPGSTSMAGALKLSKILFTLFIVFLMMQQAFSGAELGILKLALLISSSNLSVGPSSKNCFSTGSSLMHSFSTRRFKQISKSSFLSFRNSAFESSSNSMQSCIACLLGSFGTIKGTDFPTIYLKYRWSFSKSENLLVAFTCLVFLFPPENMVRILYPM